jgi:hypothetical protein
MSTETDIQDRIEPVKEGELRGSLHTEYRSCGKENCRCSSGRDEDLHGPYYYRHWRDEDGNQQIEYVRKGRVEAVRSKIQKRRRRIRQKRKERRQDARERAERKVDRMERQLDSVLP